jgi:hypothetical protein
MPEENTKQFYRYLETKSIEIKDHTHMEEAELCLKSLWENKVQHDEKVELRRREE